MTITTILLPTTTSAICQISIRMSSLACPLTIFAKAEPRCRICGSLRRWNPTRPTDFIWPWISTRPATSLVIWSKLPQNWAASPLNRWPPQYFSRIGWAALFPSVSPRRCLQVTLISWPYQFDFRRCSSAYSTKSIAILESDDPQCASSRCCSICRPCEQGSSCPSAAIWSLSRIAVALKIWMPH